MEAASATTRDLDLARREPSPDGAALRAVLIEILASDPDGDLFSFEIGPPRQLGVDDSERPGWRFSVAARLAGREFAQVRLDIVPRHEEISATERLPLPGALAFAGIPIREVEVVAPPQAYAEKLHALTRDYGATGSSRVRDLADLVLLIEDGLAPDGELLRVTRIVFDSRATHGLPLEIPAMPASWIDGYRAIAGELPVGARTLEAAMTLLRDHWRATRAHRKGE